MDSQQATIQKLATGEQTEGKMKKMLRTGNGYLGEKAAKTGAEQMGSKNHSSFFV